MVKAEQNGADEECFIAIFILPNISSLPVSWPRERKLKQWGLDPVRMSHILATS